MKVAYYNYAAIALTIVLLISQIARKSLRGRGGIAFFALLLQILLTAVFDSIAIFLDNLGAGNVAAKYFFHGGYLWLHTISSLFYVIYLISLTDTWHYFKRNRFYRIALITPAVLYLVLLFVGRFGGPRLFYIDTLNGDVYTRAEIYSVGYLIAFGYMLFGSYYIIHFRMLFSRKFLLCLFLPYILILSAVIIEFRQPELRIELLANALAYVFVAFNVQCSDELIDPYSGLNNQHAFDIDTRTAYFVHKPLKAIIISLNNYHSLRSVLDFDSGKALRQELGHLLRKENKLLNLHAEMYHGTDGHYYFLIPDSSWNNIPVLIEHLRIYFSDEHRYGDTLLTPHASIVSIELEKDISDFDTFRIFSRTGVSSLPEETITTGAELFSQKSYRMMLQMDRIINEAIFNDRLEVYFQPIYDISTSRFHSAEALIRLKDPEFGFVPPDLFIPVAERNGTIDKITEFVMGSVCDFILGKEFETIGLKYIEVNLSVVSCMQSGLSNKVLTYLTKRGVSFDKINLEITETGFAQDPEALLNNLKILSGAGVGVSLDDYGSGYSDTRRITEAPLNIVKLDRSFIWNLSNPKMEAVIRNTIKMLQDIDVRVVAEGVEDENQLNALKSMGCDYIQGFFFSRPVPIKEFIEFVSRKNQDLI